MTEPNVTPSIRRQRLAAWIRGVRVSPPPSMAADFYDGWDAAMRALMVAAFTEESPEVKSFDAIEPFRKPGPNR